MFVARVEVCGGDGEDISREVVSCAAVRSNLLDSEISFGF